MAKKVFIIVAVIITLVATATSFLLGYAYIIQSLRTMNLGRRVMRKYLEQDISLEDD